MLYPGSNFITGNISPYIVSYFGVSIPQTSDLILTTVFAVAFILPIGTHFTAKGANPKLMIAIGGAIGMILMFSASCTTNFAYFRWLYPLSFSFNNGIAFFAATQEAWKFFPDRPGFASGIILAGFGGGAFVFDNISTAIINPENY